MPVPPATGPFRGFIPFDESSGQVFFGRAREIAQLRDLTLAEGVSAVVVAGEMGVGKTSLLRAGLVPALSQRNITGLVLSSYDDLGAEILRATSRAGAEPPAATETPVDYLARVARTARAGAILILDHLERPLAGKGGDVLEIQALIERMADACGPRLRFVLCVEQSAAPRLQGLAAAAGVHAGPESWIVVERMDHEQVAEAIERSALQAGIYFEGGLSGVMAEDLCREGPCLAFDIQMLSRVVLDLRLTSVKKYRSSGGVAMLRQVFFERLCSEAGGRAARRVLLQAATEREIRAEEIEERTGLQRARIDRALEVFTDRGVLKPARTKRGPAQALVHEALRPHALEACVEERQRATAARHLLRRRVLAGERLRTAELVKVRRHLGTDLSQDEKTVYRQGLRRSVFQIGLGVVAALAILIAIFFDLRSSYTLGFAPSGSGSAARVVVRLGRPNLSSLFFLPHHPRFGSVIADTGFASSGMSEDMTSQIAAGRASGTLEHGRSTAVPGWLRNVLNGLRPVTRGVTKALVGDPDGVTALKQAFSDPLARREALEALALIGRGRAGEDEILAAALSDSSAEIRRRGVEVAAEIDRRLRHASHSPSLQNALSDKALDVRLAVLHECATLPPEEAGQILAVALRDRDQALRHQAEQEVVALAERAPAAASDAVQRVLQSNDPGVRRSGLELLEKTAGRSPAESSAALGRLVANEQLADDVRSTALGILRRTGAASPDLQAVLEKATAPEASPRLRAAALPLYARLIEPEKAEEIARGESKGPAAARAAGAAVWGTVAIKRPDLALKALKGFVYDPSPEVRVEAARSFAFLKRDGIPLVEKMLKDANPEVQRAAIDSALSLSSIGAGAIGEMLGRSAKQARPQIKKSFIEALGRMGETKPAAVLAPLAKALKDTDKPMRAAAASAFCVVARKNAAAASPYLRMASRDEDRGVRAAAAACLGDLAQGDPKGAAKMAAELALSPDSAVRTGAVDSLAKLAPRAPDVALPSLLKLLLDGERPVRATAAGALATFTAEGRTLRAFIKPAWDAERSFTTALLQGDVEERRTLIVAAAKGGLVPVVRQAASDADESVRLEAIRSAITLTPPALDVVRSAVEDRSSLVRAEATRILAASGGGVHDVLPVFAAMLRSSDASVRESAATALGNLSGAGDEPARLLGEALAHTSESVRVAAARALGRLAEQEPAAVMPFLEHALADGAHDVRSAAMPALARAWASKRSCEQLSDTMTHAEADSAHRFVALEALVAKAAGTSQDAKAARTSLETMSTSAPPLARLAAQIGKSYLELPSRPTTLPAGAAPETQAISGLHAFLERLLGG